MLLQRWSTSCSTALTRCCAAAVPQATGPPAAPEVKAAKSILDRLTGPDAAAREAAATELDSFVQKTGNIKHLEVSLELYLAVSHRYSSMNSLLTSWHAADCQVLQHY